MSMLLQRYQLFGISLSFLATVQQIVATQIDPSYVVLRHLNADRVQPRLEHHHGVQRAQRVDVEIVFARNGTNQLSFIAIYVAHVPPKCDGASKYISNFGGSTSTRPRHTARTTAISSDILSCDTNEAFILSW